MKEQNVLTLALVGLLNNSGRIADATETLAEIQGEDAETKRKRRERAKKFTGGFSERNLIIDKQGELRALEEQAQEEAIAREEARLAGIESGMHYIRSETIDGKPYVEPEIKLPKGVNLLDPNSVKGHLDGIVFGQLQATKSMAIGITDIYHRIKSAYEKKRASNFEKGNLLFIGPSGTGKTYLAFSAAELIAVPVVKVAATSLASIGDKGFDFRGVLREFCKFDIYADKSGKQEKRLSLKKGAEYGVLIIDEIDKLRARERLQHELLPILERGEYNLGEGIIFDTSNLWVVATGAFYGIEEIVKTRLRKGIFRGRSRKDLLSHISEQDLVNYGFIPELARRFQGYVPFISLSEDALYKISTEPEDSSLSQYKERFKSRDLDFEAEEGALRAIVNYCMQYSQGANGLRVGFRKATEDLLYQPHKYQKGEKIVLTEKHTRKVLNI